MVQGVGRWILMGLLTAAALGLGRSERSEAAPPWTVDNQTGGNVRPGGPMPGAPLPRATGGGSQVATLNPRLGGPRGGSATEAVPDRTRTMYQQYGGLSVNRPTTGAVANGTGRTTQNVIGQAKSVPIPGGTRRNR